MPLAERLKSILFGGPERGTIRFGEVPAQITDMRLFRNEAFSFHPHEGNLRMTRERGFEPSTLRKIIDQVGVDVLSESVLFDTPPVDTPPVEGNLGNHWRLVGIDEEKQVGVLQLCNRLGTRDITEVLPFEVPFDTPMFTGLSKMAYEIDGHRVKLSTVVQSVKEAKKEGKSLPENLKNRVLTTYRTDKSGTLRVANVHFY